MNGQTLPAALLESLEGVEGFDRKRFESIHAGGMLPVSVRFNPAKTGAGAAGHFRGAERVPWSSQGYYLPERPSFTLDPWLHAGAYYVQEASSMFIEQCLRQTTGLSNPLKVLDLCAAPGGKSTLLQSLIHAESLLVSNEVIRARVGILLENMIKWGGSNTVVTHNDPGDFARLPGYFDVMVVDAPCSGSGLFRKDPGAIGEWSIEAVNRCSLRQQRILADAYATLRQHGVLIYSTCSYSAAENEAICDWLCATFDVEPLALQLHSTWHITETYSRNFHCPGYRFFPYHTAGEGFFTACFRKNDGDRFPPATGRSRLNPVSAREKQALEPWIDEVKGLRFYHQNGSVLAFPQMAEPDLIRLSGSLYVKRAGVFCGKLAQGGLIPDHELAVSGLAAGNILAISLGREEALRYLRKEEIVVNSEARGWALVRYEGLNLGWLKLIGSRTNNYYPKEWRILKSGNS